MKPPTLSGAQVARWMKRQVMDRHKQAVGMAWTEGGKEQVDRVSRDTAEKLNQINNLFKLLKLP